MRRNLFLVLLWLLALALGSSIGILDLHAKEVQGTVLLILIASGLFGFAQPRWAWLWAVTFGLSLFLVGLVATMLGYPTHDDPNIFATLIALIPAFLGAYAGVLLRYVIAPPHRA